MELFEDVIKVGIADMNIAKAPRKIRTTGLGSCVGLVIYDEKIKIVGLAHIMLPDSSLANKTSLNVAKYADTAVKELIHRLKQNGGKAARFKAKIAGGAEMFPTQNTSEMMRIGPRNVEAVRKHLKAFNIPVVGEDVGGSNGRTIEFDTNSLVLTIRTVNLGVKKI